MSFVFVFVFRVFWVLFTYLFYLFIVLIYFFFTYLFLLIYFNWRIITLQWCDGFAMQQHELAIGKHMYPSS